jgi:hypothetical protein
LLKLVAGAGHGAGHVTILRVLSAQKETAEEVKQVEVDEVLQGEYAEAADSSAKLPASPLLSAAPA